VVSLVDSVHYLSWNIDVKTEKQFVSLETTSVPLDRSQLPLSENPDHYPRRTNLQSGDAFESVKLKILG
jgi:hypothetical protein